MKGKIKLDKKIKALPQKKKRKKLLFIAISSSAFLLIIGGLYFLKELYFDTPEFFPLDNPNGIYQITKGCPSGQGWEEHAMTNHDDGYCIEYRGNGVFYPTKKNSHFFRITVGHTSFNLEQHLNKRIKNIQGKFTISDKQCIHGACNRLNGNIAVLNIDFFELK